VASVLPQPTGAKVFLLLFFQKKKRVSECSFEPVDRPAARFDRSVVDAGIFRLGWREICRDRRLVWVAFFADNKDIK
jgi:hypothetical protein